MTTATERTPERLRAHYEIERELADRLRASSFDERTTLYREVYEELFARVPDHPQLTWTQDARARAATVRKQIALIEPFLGPETSFLEIGAGDCAMSAGVAARTRGEVHAIDVSPTIVEMTDLPANVQVHLSDGRDIPVAPGSVDLAYSNQLLEHLHPDDAILQTRNVIAALRPGGVYVCLTPNRLGGPHDISALYDDEATGFHLREYTTGDLQRFFAEAGFARLRVLIPLGARTLVLPPAPFVVLERLLEALPGRLGPRLARRSPLNRIFGRVAAYR